MIKYLEKKSKCQRNLIWNHSGSKRYYRKCLNNMSETVETLQHWSLLVLPCQLIFQRIHRINIDKINTLERGDAIPPGIVDSLLIRLLAKEGYELKPSM